MPRINRARRSNRTRVSSVKRSRTPLKSVRRASSKRTSVRRTSNNRATNRVIQSRGRSNRGRVNKRSCPAGQMMNANGVCQNRSSFISMSGQTVPGTVMRRNRKKNISRNVNNRKPSRINNKLNTDRLNSERKVNSFRVRPTMFGYEVK